MFDRLLLRVWIHKWIYYNCLAFRPGDYEARNSKVELTIRQLTIEKASRSSFLSSIVLIVL